MKKITALFLTAVLLISAIQPICVAYANESITSVSPDQAAKSTTAQEDDVTFEFGTYQFDTGERYVTLYYAYDSPYMDTRSRRILYTCKNKGDSPVTLSFSSSNTDVAKITSDKKITLDAGDTLRDAQIWVTIGNPGYSEISVSVGNTTYRTRVYVFPLSLEISKSTQIDFRHIKLQWKKVPGCTGYYLQRSKNYEDGFQTIKTLDVNQTSITLPAKTNVEYYYKIVAYIKDDERIVIAENGLWERFTAQKMAGSPITSVKKIGSSSLEIKWKAFKSATGYKLYRSTQENGTYKCIYTTKSGKITSFKQKVSKGVPYYYKLVTIDAMGKSDFSPIKSQFIPTKNKTKKISYSKITQAASNGLGQYSYYCAHPDKTYYYQSGGKFHTVCVQNNGNLKIYTLSPSFKVQKTKTIKLKYDVWGGFYQGTDGNFYIAVGYHNPKESKTKTVIKVIQYNSKWKKLKTANIKGNAKNAFVGIYAPFEAGNCRMDMQGKTLYLMTSRKMFMGSDGLRHQSNISFKINTKNMKATDANESYASHSFNQFVKFKDGSLYLLDHGDAYPRGLQLTTVSDYGTDKQKANSLSIFDFEGNTGANFTGCRVGGMEVGSKNVLVCGTSQPHKHKIKKVSGFDYEMKYNAFLALANRKSGKITFKWLTTYHPKTTSVTVGETRMVKLSDNHFAILYTTTQKGKTTLNYAVYSDTGKKIYSKKYPNMVFDGDSQPILHNGSIVWISPIENNGKITSKLYSIPATF